MTVVDGERYDAAQMAEEADGRWQESMRKAKLLRMGAEVLDILAKTLDTTPHRVMSDEDLRLKTGHVMDALGEVRTPAMADAAREIRDEIYAAAGSKEGQARAAKDTADFLFEQSLHNDSAAEDVVS